MSVYPAPAVQQTAASRATSGAGAVACGGHSWTHRRQRLQRPFGHWPTTGAPVNAAGWTVAAGAQNLRGASCLPPPLRLYSGPLLSLRWQQLCGGQPFPSVWIGCCCWAASYGGAVSHCVVAPAVVARAVAGGLALPSQPASGGSRRSQHRWQPN